MSQELDFALRALCYAAVAVLARPFIKELVALGFLACFTVARVLGAWRRGRALTRAERRLVEDGKLIEAIKAVRARTSLHLIDAKAIVDRYRDHLADDVGRGLER